MADQMDRESLELAWEHLKCYGYAPGHYMSRCHRCNAAKTDMDKRAITCRPCAEAMHAERLAGGGE